MGYGMLALFRKKKYLGNTRKEVIHGGCLNISASINYSGISSGLTKIDKFWSTLSLLPSVFFFSLAEPYFMITFSLNDNTFLLLTFNSDIMRGVPYLSPFICDQ